MTREEIELAMKKAFERGWKMSREWPNHNAYDLEVKWARAVGTKVPQPLLPYLKFAPRHNLDQFR
jgi:hypothetical protein